MDARDELGDSQWVTESRSKMARQSGCSQRTGSKIKDDIPIAGQ